MLAIPGLFNLQHNRFNYEDVVHSLLSQSTLALSDPTLSSCPSRLVFTVLNIPYFSFYQFTLRNSLPS
jgi:hypothetical protein